MSLNTDIAPEPNTCFSDSRRLTGHNRFFSGTGAVLETLGPTAHDTVAHDRWRTLVGGVRIALGWQEQPVIARSHAGGATLAIAAPADELFTATEINEWAWEQASGLFAPGKPIATDPPFDQVHVLGDDIKAVNAAFAARRALEIDPVLHALRRTAEARGISILCDDETVSLGAGSGSLSWPLTGTPGLDGVPWIRLHDVPVALVTGSNGKTTTVRLLAALLDASGAPFKGHVGYSSTEGVMIGATHAGDGDFSGPAGARVVLRDARVAAAVLETARGGILRRGLAVARADVAVITNISADHFGEYGIDNLDDLADVKFTVVRALDADGTLVLNADDSTLLARAKMQSCKVALFAGEDMHPALVAHRDRGGSTCARSGDQLWLTVGGIRTSLGEISEMPLTLGGAAAYNLANIAAAALAAAAMKISPEVIAIELKRFGRNRHDNPGRLSRWTLADITVLIDYAHNPDGLALLLGACRSFQRSADAGSGGLRMGHMGRKGRKGGKGRLGLLLGQAGNRRDQAIEELARMAVQFAPELIVIKEIASMRRGRAPGEVPELLRRNLIAAGYARENIKLLGDETGAARQLLRWARCGDLIVLPIHQTGSRHALEMLLDEMETQNWRVGMPLPDLK